MCLNYRLYSLRKAVTLQVFHHVNPAVLLKSLSQMYRKSKGLKGQTQIHTRADSNECFPFIFLSIRSFLSLWRWPLRTCRKKHRSCFWPQTKSLPTPRCCRWCCRAVLAPLSTRFVFFFISHSTYFHITAIRVGSKVWVSVFSSDTHSSADL